VLLNKAIVYSTNTLEEGDWGAATLVHGDDPHDLEIPTELPETRQIFGDVLRVG